jgi:hypothetical protein
MSYYGSFKNARNLQMYNDERTSNEIKHKTIKKEGRQGGYSTGQL